MKESTKKTSASNLQEFSPQTMIGARFTRAVIRKQAGVIGKELRKTKEKVKSGAVSPLRGAGRVAKTAGEEAGVLRKRPPATGAQKIKQSAGETFRVVRKEGGKLLRSVGKQIEKRTGIAKKTKNLRKASFRKNPAMRALVGAGIGGVAAEVTAKQRKKTAGAAGAATGALAGSRLLRSPTLAVPVALGGGGIVGAIVGAGRKKKAVAKESVQEGKLGDTESKERLAVVGSALGGAALGARKRSGVGSLVTNLKPIRLTRGLVGGGLGLIGGEGLVRLGRLKRGLKKKKKKVEESILEKRLQSRGEAARDVAVAGTKGVIAGGAGGAAASFLDLKRAITSKEKELATIGKEPGGAAKVKRIRNLPGNRVPTGKARSRALGRALQRGGRRGLVAGGLGLGGLRLLLGRRAVAEQISQRQSKGISQEQLVTNLGILLEREHV
jgi:hypothetical protein